MPKSNSVFVCQSCEASFPKWQGQCDNCGEWNTLVETAAQPKSGRKAGQAASAPVVDAAKLQVFSEVKTLSSQKQRFSSGLGELDRVLGGGIVPGAVMLIGGEPGIGKSTLLTQVVIEQLAGDEGAKSQKTTKKSSRTKSVQLQPQSRSLSRPILYVCGEESPSQIALRINRILDNEHPETSKKSGKNMDSKAAEQLVFSTATQVEEVVATLKKLSPRLVIIDSIQTMTTSELMGAAGSAGQVRESADQLTTAAKALGIPLFMVGHVTKEGTIAGPKVLEHIVDTVLELSGERTDDLRLLRAIKNRFGATDEVGVFRVAEFGLAEVSNPSEIFLEHQAGSVPGSATVCVMEGTRPLLVEVQSLVVGSQLAMPRRVGRGIELSRIQVLAAILQKHSKLPLGSHDIFVSAAGGFKIKEPAVDLGLAVAVASSLQNKPLPDKTVFIGEVGLLGEVRSVNYLERRIKEAKRLGFTTIISRDSHQKAQAVLQEFGLTGRAKS